MMVVQASGSGRRAPGLEPEAWSLEPNVGGAALRGDFDVDRARLGFFPIRELHRQHAVLVLGADLARIHGVRQRERAMERAVAALDAADVLVLDALGQLLGAAQDE